MKIALIFPILIFLASCSVFQKSNEVAPYDRYTSYIVALKAGNYDSALSMLTTHNQKLFSNSTTGESFNAFFPFFSSIGTVVTDELSHYQNLIKAKSCLTISGFNDAGEPTSLNLELLNEDGQWKFSYVQIIYHESKKEFSSFPKCPAKPQ